MPGAKRKQEAADGQPKKRTRAATSSDEEDDPQATILLLESEIAESKKNYNNIAKLIAIAKDGVDSGEETAVVAAVSLCRVFIRLLAAGSLRKQKGASDKDTVVVQWLKDRLVEYEQILKGVFSREEWASTAMTLSMRLLKAEGQYPHKEEYTFPRPFLTEIVRMVMVHQDSVEDLLREFVETFVDAYDDIRFYTFRSVTEMLSQPAENNSTETGDFPAGGFFDDAFALLSSIDGVPDSSEELEDFYVEAPKKTSHPLHSITQHKRQAQDAWLALLRLGPNKEQRKRVLNVMSDVVAPWFTKPELLMDFLTDCYNAGGSMSLLSLSGVFYLIQEKNLDYPAFYSKLYSLLDADVLHSKHRSRFFRLMDTFLGSSHLPAQLVASFIKRLSRLCLFAPPSAIVTVVPWMYNLFKKHPLCTFMMHRVPRTQEERDWMEREGLADPYLPDEADPMKTNAIDSCVWEIVQLQSHYHPNVSTIAKIISEQFTKQFYSLEDFLDHSYSSVSWHRGQNSATP